MVIHNDWRIRESTASHYTLMSPATVNLTTIRQTDRGTTVVTAKPVTAWSLAVITLLPIGGNAGRGGTVGLPGVRVRANPANQPLANEAHAGSPSPLAGLIDEGTHDWRRRERGPPAAYHIAPLSSLADSEGSRLRSERRQ